MSKVYNKLEEQVTRGRQGLTAGVPTGLARLDEYTTGIHQGDYFLIGAETNVGKTKFVRDRFIYQPYQFWLANKDKFNIHFIDVSLEMTSEDNLADFIAKDIYYDYGKIVDRNALLSRRRDKDGKPKLLGDDMLKLFHSYKEKYEEFEKHLDIIDTDVNPSLFHDILYKYAKKNGKFENPDARWISKAGAYTPDDPTLLTIIIFDTINLADTEDRQMLKQSMDRISRIAVWFRKVCNFTPVIIQQFNAEISGTDRNRYGIKTPLLRDFEDSKRTTKDATIVLGLFDPTRHQMGTLLGYDIVTLQSWFRSIHLLKNRNGDMNKAVGMLFRGAIGEFTELPKADEMTAPEYARLMKY